MTTEHTQQVDTAASPQTLTITPRDIDSRVCQLCGACCRIYIPLPKTDSRYRMFLRGIGHTVFPAAKSATEDCCTKVHDARLDLGWCQYLRIAEDGQRPSYSCSLYGTTRFPQLCAQYNCVSWALAHNLYSPNNGMLRAAQSAFSAATEAESNKECSEEVPVPHE